MIRCVPWCLVFIANLCAVNTVMGGQVVETFEAGTNPSQWTWGIGTSLPASGGNPNGHLRTDGLVIAMPQLRPTLANSVFLGNYRAAQVTCIGVDLVAFDIDFLPTNAPLTLMLIHDNGTPSNVSDDTAAYFMHAQNIPSPAQGWVSYNFDVPSQQSSLPSGWVLLNLGNSGAPAIHTWNQVIQSVSRMRFHYGNPMSASISQQWSLGMDNARICVGFPGPCPADYNNDEIVGVPDLLTLINEWGPCIPPCSADLTGDNVVGVPDLLTLINAWGPCD